MNILIVSDSHGLQEELFQLLEQYKEKVDLIIHCGDSELPKEAFSAYDNFLIVKGNCDFDDQYDDEISFHKNNASFYITHGHRYNVKVTMNHLLYRAEELNANIVCFGHSHIATCFLHQGIVFINPGSIRLPKLRKDRSYAIAQLSEERTMITFYNHLGQEISDLKTIF